MRKFLLGLSILAGIGAASAFPAAAATLGQPAMFVSAPAQQVDARDWQRHEAWERAGRLARHHEALRQAGHRPYDVHRGSRSPYYR